MAVEDRKEEQVESQVLEEPTDSGEEDSTEQCVAETFTQLDVRLAAVFAAAVDTRAQEWNTYMEAWKS